MLDSPHIGTHYYKLAHLTSVNYYTYTSTVANDHNLLETELLIRHKYPKILLSYYGKCLFYFTFGHIDSLDNNSGIDLVNQFPGLQLSSSNSINVDLLTSQPKSPPDSISTNGTTEKNSNGQATTSENCMAIASCFVKTIKKMIIYNLSLHNMVTLFGNYCLINQDTHYSCLFIDPILIPNGDILISIMIKNNPKLFPSSLISNSLHLNLDLDSNFAIYLIPSGIRCHLFDPSLFSANIVNNVDDSNQSTLLNLIKLCTGISEFPKSIVWIKLVPNLRHLNSQTSPISKFIHTVDNKKSILWPWHLCCLQFGKLEEIESLITNPVDEIKNSNPLDLISDFLDFNIGQNQRSQHQRNHSNGISSIAATGSVGATHYTHINTDANSVDLNDMNSPSGLFGLQNDANDFFGKTDTLVDMSLKNEDAHGIIKTEENDDDTEMDDLFGASEGSDDNMEEITTNAQPEILLGEETVVMEKEPIVAMDSIKGEETFDFFEEKIQDLPSVKDKPTVADAKALDNSFKPDALKLVKNSIIDIPRDQMTIRKTNTPIYNDPGAPVPVTFTPIIPQSVPSVVSTVAPASIGPNAEEQQSKSVFSPILFNPIIKSNIDTKYGKGGKFYVDKDINDDDLDKKKKSIRATSVSGIELPFSKDSSIRNKAFESAIEESENSFSGSSEESDEDEELENDIHDMSPLKLYTANDNFQNTSMVSNLVDESGQPGGLNINHENTPSKDIPGGDKQFPNFKNYSSGVLASPNLNSRFATFRGESPFFSNDLGHIGSPVDFEQTNTQSPASQQRSPNHQQSPPSTTQQLDSKTVSDSPKGMTEFLSLILRCVNVSSIPNEFLLNNQISDKLMPSFDINDVDNENDLQLSKNNEMIVKAKNIEQLLKYLIPNLIFDLGLNSRNSNISYYFGGSENKLIDEIKTKLIDFHHPDREFEKVFSKLFPNSYKVSLSELLLDVKDFEDSDSLDNQLDFLDEITSDFDLLNPRNQFKKLKTLAWDSIVPEASEENANKYKQIMQQLCSNCHFKDDVHFKLPTVKAKVIKNSNIVNLNSIGLDFWKLLNFSPIKEAKNFQLIMISEIDETGSTYALEFLNLLTSSYTECNLGHISRVNLSPIEDRSESEGIHNGLILLNKEIGQTYNDIYNQIDKSLSNLVELIKQDLMNKTNNFEFDRPLLLLFVNFNKNLNSFLQIAKIFRNFKLALQAHQLPLVKIFTKIIPSSFIVKQKNHQSRLKTLGNMKLAKLALNLYNQCPNGFINRELTRNLYSQLVREPPSSIQFKFMNNKGKNFNDDVFLHLAYERSIDKNWIAAAWSDPIGIVTYTKCWYCSRGERETKKGTADLGSVIEDIWNISCDLFKRVNDEMNCTNALGGKKFLVLTRINSVIPEVELYHWKRLSVKHKEISLIVLSVNRSPKLAFTNNEEKTGNISVSDSTTNLENTLQTSLQPALQLLNPNQDREPYLKSFSVSNNASPNYLSATSPSNVINFHSPQNFLNAPGNFLSPQDIVSVGSGQSNNVMNAGNDGEMMLHDSSGDLYGIVPKLPIPSFFTNNRSGSKLGYIIKEFKNEKENGHLVFEVCILSCSNFWNSETLLALILNHYKKLILLNDVVGIRNLEGNVVSTEANGQDNENITYEIEGIIPWHIAAVGKALDYLVHIYVEE